MKPIKALLFKYQDNNTLTVKGPIMAQRTRGMDADYVILLCDYDTMVDPRNKEDIDLFKNCLMSSTIDANPLDQMCTLSYMLGTVANMHLKNFNFDKLIFENY